MSGTKRTNVISITANANKEKGETPMAKKTEAAKASVTMISPKGSDKVKLSDLEPIALTQEEFKSKTSQELASLIDGRLSRERAKVELVGRIREGRIKIKEASTLMDWTYKGVSVDGVKAKVRGIKKPEVTLTQEQFDALSDAEKAGYIEQYTHKRRVAESILPELIRRGMPLSAKDVVYLTNGRIAIEGVVIEGRNNKKQVALTDGVEFS